MVGGGEGVFSPRTRGSPSARLVRESGRVGGRWLRATWLYATPHSSRHQPPMDRQTSRMELAKAMKPRRAGPLDAGLITASLATEGRTGSTDMN